MPSPTSARCPAPSFGRVRPKSLVGRHPHAAADTSKVPCSELQPGTSQIFVGRHPHAAADISKMPCPELQPGASQLFVGRHPHAAADTSKMPCSELRPVGLPQGAGRFYICPAAMTAGQEQAAPSLLRSLGRTALICRATFPAGSNKSWEANRTPMLLELLGLFLLRAATRALF